MRWTIAVIVMIIGSLISSVVPAAWKYTIGFATGSIVQLVLDETR